MTAAVSKGTTAQGAVGVAHTRVDGRDKVTGAARYSAEIPFAELAHGWLVLSTVARGRVRSLDTAPVLRMPGVLTVLHHGNAPRVDNDYMTLLGVPPDPTVALFQHDRVPYLGWPVAVVVAETSEQAREAAEALVVHYERQPHDVDFAGSRPDTYPLDTYQPAVVEKGDLEAQLAASAVVVDAEYTTPEEHHHAMEPHAATAVWDDGRLKSSTPTRAPPTSRAKSPGCSRSTRPPCGCAPSSSAAASGPRNTSGRTRWPPRWPLTSCGGRSASS